MTSKINPTKINIDYPVANTNNSSQGFRDNFGVIQQDFQTASLEISQLQNLQLSLLGVVNSPPVSLISSGNNLQLRTDFASSDLGASLNFPGSGAIQVPIGYTSQRPASTPLRPAKGMLRYNLDFERLEYYQGTRWVGVQDTSVATQFKNPPSLLSGPGPELQNAHGLIVYNLPFIRSQVSYWVTQNYPTGYTLTNAQKNKCARDVGLIVLAVLDDVLTGGNINSVAAGNAYYNGTASVLAYNSPAQRQLTADALEFALSLIKSILSNQSVSIAPGYPVSPSQTIVPDFVNGNLAYAQFATNMRLIANIIVDGPSQLPANYVPTSSGNFAAQTLVYDNLSFLVAEGAQYVENNKPVGYTYDVNKCKRDIELIVECVMADVMAGINLNSVIAGNRYWNGNSNVLGDATHRTLTINTFNYVRDLIVQVINNQAVVSPLQAVVSQVIDTAYTNGVRWSDDIIDRFEIITGIISSQPIAISPIAGPPGATGATGPAGTSGSGSGGLANPAGPDASVQYNDGGVLQGNSKFQFDGDAVIAEEMRIGQLIANSDTISNLLDVGNVNINARGHINKIRVTNPGSGYTTVPAITIEPPGQGGIQAQAIAHMGAVAASTYNRGSRYLPGDQLTVIGGTSLTPTKLTIDTVRIKNDPLNPDKTKITPTVDKNNRGLGYMPNDSLVVVGGSGPAPATLIITRVRLINPTIVHAGDNYIDGDRVTVFGGSSTYPATATVSVQSDTVVEVSPGVFKEKGPVTGIRMDPSVDPDDILNPGPTGPGSYREVPNLLANTMVGGSGSGLIVEFETAVDIVQMQNQGPYDGLGPIDSQGKPVMLTRNRAVGGSGSGALFNLESEINVVRVSDPGDYSFLPFVLNNQVTTNSAYGSGATVNLSYGVIRAEVQNAGTAYTRTPVITVEDTPSGNMAKLSADMTGTRVSIGDLMVTGRARGTGPVTTNVLYVTLDGDDANDGMAQDRAKRTIKAACAAAEAGTTIFVKSGNYVENNPIYVPAFVSIIGDNLRRVNLYYRNPTQDFFWVNNACYIAGMSFRGGMAPGFAIAYPPTGAGNIVTSPYVQNCTCFNSTGGGMKVDGNLAKGLKSMVLDAFTQFNQGGPGILITNQGYAQLVSIFTICCTIAKEVSAGGTCSVNNSNTTFGDIGFLADGISPYLFGGIIKSGSGDPNRGRYKIDTLSVQKVAQRPYVGIVATIGPEFSYVNEVKILDQGIGYKSQPGDQPLVVFDPPLGYAGKQAQALAQVDSEGGISAITITDSGGGYTGPTTVTIYDISGTGALVTTVIYSNLDKPLILNGGKGYKVNDVIAINGGTYPDLANSSPLLLKVTGVDGVGAVTDISVLDSGDYTELPIASGAKTTATDASLLVSFSDGTLTSNGVGFSCAINFGFRDKGSQAKIYRNDALTILNHGQGYAVGETITVPGGTPSDLVTPSRMQLTVSKVDTAGKVQQVLIESLGSYSTLPPSNVSSTTSDGSGTGFTLLINWDMIYVPSRNAITVTNAGQGYKSPQVYISGTGGITAKGTTVYNADTGTISGVNLISQGGGYVSQPTVMIRGGGGIREVETGATAVTEVTDGVVTKVRITNPGNNFVIDPEISFSGGGGAGAKVGRILYQTVNAQVTSFVTRGTGQKLIQGGSGYQINDLVEVVGGVAESVSGIQFTTRLIVTQVTSNSQTSGIVTQVQIDRAGQYSVMPPVNGAETRPDPTQPVNQQSQGTGLLVDLSLGLAEISVDPQHGGSGGNSYVPGPRVRFVGGNAQSLSFQAGLDYYEGTTRRIPQSLVSNTVSAMGLVKELAKKTILNQPVPFPLAPYGGSFQTSPAIDQVVDVALVPEISVTTLAIDACFRHMTDFINLGPSLTAYDNASSLLLLNKAFLQAELSAWIDKTYPGLLSETERADRKKDVGLIVDALAIDVSVGGYVRSMRAANTYFNGALPVLPVNQYQPIVQALGYLQTLGLQIIANDEIAISGLAQTAVRQVTQASLNDGERASNNLSSAISMMVYKLENGISMARIEDATNLLRANISFIKAESIGYMRSLYGSGFSLTVEQEDQFLKDVATAIEAVAEDILGGGGIPAQAQAMLYPKYYTVNFATPLVINGGDILVSPVDRSLSRRSGEIYWEGTNSVFTTPGYAEQRDATTSAINRLLSLSTSVVSNSLVPVFDLDTTAKQTIDTNYTDGSSWTSTITTLMDSIVDIIQNGTVSQSQNQDYLNAQSLIIYNLPFIREQVSQWVQDNYPAGYSLTASQIQKCKRDVGVIVLAVMNDVLGGTSTNSVAAGNAYWNGTNSVLSYNSAEQKQLTSDALDYAKTLIQKIINNEQIQPDYPVNDAQVIVSSFTNGGNAWSTISSLMSTVQSIILNGTSSDPANPIPTQAGNFSVQTLVFDNLNFIAAETIGYINQNYPSLDYDRSKCERDVKLILECVLADVMSGVTFNSTLAGNRYWVGATRVIGSNEVPATVAALNFVTGLVTNVVSNTAVSTSYQTSSQITDGSLSNGNKAENAITSLMNRIIHIIVNNPTQSLASYNHAPQLIEANRLWLVQQVGSWVETNVPSLTPSQKDLCSRDVGFILDAIKSDITSGGFGNSIFAGRSYWNGVISLIPDQVSQTQGALDFLRQLCLGVVQNQIPGVTLYPTLDSQVFDSGLDQGNLSIDHIEAAFDIMISLISTDPDQGPGLQPYHHAAQLLRLNKSFLQAQVRQFVVSTYGSSFLTPDRLDLCTRDVGFLVDAAAGDITGSGANPLPVTSDNETAVTFDEVTDYAPLDNEKVNFYQVSMASVSSHQFEFVGSGTDINTCLPQTGGVPITANEVVMRRGGRVYYTSTDHRGDFRIGPGLVINQNTGTLSGRTFAKSLFGLITPFVLSIEASS